MKSAFYRFLIELSRHGGFWILGFFTWWITTGYFFLIPGRLAISIRFYRAVFPDRGLFYPLLCSWKQYHHFSRIFLDRLLLADAMSPLHTQEGWEYLEEAVNRQTGGIVLMSHIGNWEVASRLLNTRGRDNPGMKLLLYLGEKHKEQLEKNQKESVASSGIRIISVTKEGGTPADIVEGIQFLKSGGLVSLTGDRLWHTEQRSVRVHFFGHEAFLPETPFIFALLSGAPLFIFFTYRIAGQAYHYQVLPPQYIRARDRAHREEAIQKAAQFFADRLAEIVRTHPWEWFHFEPFLGKKWTH